MQKTYNSKTHDSRPKHANCKTSRQSTNRMPSANRCLLLLQTSNFNENYVFCTMLYQSTATWLHIVYGYTSQTTSYIYIFQLSIQTIGCSQNDVGKNRGAQAHSTTGNDLETLHHGASCAENKITAHCADFRHRQLYGLVSRSSYSVY